MLREDVIVVITPEEWKKLRTCNYWLGVENYVRIDLAEKNEMGRIGDVRFFFKEWEKIKIRCKNCGQLSEANKSIHVCDDCFPLCQSDKPIKAQPK
jgi:hypothetical protein